MKARTRHTRSTVIDSDDSQSDSDASEARENGFFDDEALESAESTEEVSGSDEEEIDPFPFTRLPPELRLRVWTLFCPDLLGAPRVLDFNVHDSLSPTRTSPCKIIGAGMCLEDQTRALRCVLATNQQSRAIAKQRFPDELRLESDNGEEFTLCVNVKVDIAMLDRVPDFSQDDAMLGITATRVNLDGFSQFIVNLALPLNDSDLFEQDTDISSWLRKFRSLQRIFLYTNDDNYAGRRLKDDAVRWCAASSARQYYMETFEKEPGYGEDYTKIVCWPDSQQSPAFTKAHVPKWHTKFLFQTQENAFEEAGVKTHPMVIFQTEEGLERYDHFVATDYLPLKVYGANEDDSEAESYEEDPDEDFELNGASEMVDDYESDGIDDDDPEIFDESGDEHLDDGDSDDGDGDGDGMPPNPFSSPEPSEDEGGPSVRGRKRHVIADSDDDEGDELSSRPTKRKRVHVIEDSDDENSPAEDSQPQVLSSDEDEAPTKRRRVEIIDSDEESEDGSEEDSDQPQHASLANRLQIRSRSRRALSDEDDSEEEEGDLDEDEEEDDEEDGEDEDEDGLIDNMAAESGEDEEDDEDEEDE